jgi:hypothetical protein
MAKTAFVVTDAVREKVRYLAGLGGRQDDIAKFIGCAPKTLRKRFRGELDRGVAEANATISGSLFASAKGGNVTAQIFWLKTRDCGNGSDHHLRAAASGSASRGGDRDAVPPSRTACARRWPSGTPCNRRRFRIVADRLNELIALAVRVSSVATNPISR